MTPLHFSDLNEIIAAFGMIKNEVSAFTHEFGRKPLVFVTVSCVADTLQILLDLVPFSYFGELMIVSLAMCDGKMFVLICLRYVWSAILI